MPLLNTLRCYPGLSLPMAEECFSSSLPCLPEPSYSQCFINVSATIALSKSTRWVEWHHGLIVSSSWIVCEKNVHHFRGGWASACRAGAPPSHK